MARKINKKICKINSYHNSKISFYFYGYGIEVKYDKEIKSDKIEISYYGSSRNFKTFEIVSFEIV